MDYYVAHPNSMDDDLWIHSKSIVSDGMGLGYYREREVELIHRGFTILEGVSDPLHLPKIAARFLPPPRRYPDKSFQDLLQFVMDTFTNKKAVKEEKKQLHWSPIANSGIEAKEEKLPDSGVARHKSTLKLLGEYLESSEDRVWTKVIHKIMYV